MGRNVAVLDNAQVSGAELGNDVVIAPGARVAASASIGAGAMVGMGAQVLAGARVGSDSFIDAGAVVAAGTVVPSGQLWTGVPARHLRALAPAEVAYLRSSALAYADLSSVHCAQGAKGPEAVEEDEDLRWAKLEGGYAPNIPVSEEDADVIQYFKLTEKHANPGLWRDAETDVAAELARREAAEIAEDRAEEAYHNAVARNKRVAEALGALAATRADRPEAREEVLAALARRDAEGEGMLQALMQRATAASAPGAQPLAKEEVLRAIRALSPGAPSPLQPLRCHHCCGNGQEGLRCAAVLAALAAAAAAALGAAAAAVEHGQGGG